MDPHNYIVMLNWSRLVFLSHWCIHPTRWTQKKGTIFSYKTGGMRWAPQLTKYSVETLLIKSLESSGWSAFACWGKNAVQCIRKDNLWVSITFKKWLNFVDASDSAAKYLSVQLFWAAGRRQTEVNLALSSMLVGVWNVLRLHGVPNWLSSSETLSGKIHCVLGIMVDLHSFSQGLRISAVALSWHMTAFCTVKRIKQNKQKNRCNKGPCQTSHVSNLILRPCFKFHMFTVLDSRSEAQAVVP